MASGDGLDDDANEDREDPEIPEGVVPPAARSDPGVDTAWLRRHHTRHRGWPRWSTLALVAAFLAVLVLYLLVRP